MGDVCVCVVCHLCGVSCVVSCVVCGVWCVVCVELCCVLLCCVEVYGVVFCCCCVVVCGVVWCSVFSPARRWCLFKNENPISESIGNNENQKKNENS